MKIQNKEPLTNKYMLEQELFWNNIMKEHAQFIRGLLDPSENDLTTISLNETMNFKQFKVAGEEGILNCKIKSIIIPLLADHVVREVNHFIRLLKSINNNQ